MADMAPALTGAPQEAPHRLKLSASSPATERGLPVWKPELNGAGSLLLLNGRSEDCAPERPGKSRWLPEAEDRRPENVPESGITAVEDRPGEGAETGALCARRAARMSSRQQELGARARRLCRRLQVIQAKQVERHVRQQLAGLVELLAERGAAGLPGSPHTELDRLASSSTARLRAAQGGFDSDATESSSGEESDGEEASESSPERGERSEEEPRPAPGSHQRAQWRWTMERAAIICRWTWLQAQVSDLEFRIRQQTEIYKQIRCTKGSVVLGDSPQSEDTTPRQSAGPSAVLNTRGSRLPSSSCSPSVVKAPSGNSLCQASSVTSSSSALPSADKQCSRLTQSENVACQNPPTKSVCDFPGSQKSSRQVNGFINCVRPSLSCNGSSEDLDPEEVLGKKRRVEGLSAAPALPDSSCMAARTRPLRGHKKRRLVRSSEVSSLSRKPQKQLSTKCGCEPPTTCILCGCKTYLKTTHPSTMSERIALIDPCYHPILSFPYDTPLNLHFEALLKEDRQFRVSHKLKALKFSQLSKKPSEKLRRDCHSPTPDFTGRSLFREDKQHRGTPNSSIHISSPVTPRPSNAAQQLSSLTETPPSSNSAALKRKRFENSYDIDNIVIPMSMAAAARVEKIQYKEILTPSWRELDPSEQTSLEEDPQLEDLSAEAYQNRHSAYEDMERSRWDSWTSAASQRRGSRSSNKSDGRWTPQPSSNSQGSFQQPASPDFGFHSLNEVPLTLSSAATDNQEPYSTLQCLSVYSRTRGLSWSEDTRSSTPEVPDEEEQTVAPWEHRSFPLSDRDHRVLQSSPVTAPNRNRNKPDVLCNAGSKSGLQAEGMDSGMSAEDLITTSKDPPLPNSISVVRFRAHSGEKIASLEYFPTRPVNKR
ncbi:KAT8 regulatory NSL complex subunit 1-like isoform X2 [Bufo gargarizans]|uniref:KAT8 regulatory NSL complex subunit 1-like isoform X2 n=1 Tax=Bufo gargarizans TaxID=30331 RepID=UPI001CF3C24B|nr:KAT8 regulatory NSL complex subunit 1-like isoform X2 [Bufo gargarizans]